MAENNPVILWFRRDLRLKDHPALLKAVEQSRQVLALYVLDEALLKPAGNPRLTFMSGCLRALSEQLDGRLMIVKGDPVKEVPKVAQSVGAAAVHVSADTGPYGRKRDDEVAKTLQEQGIDWVETGSSYAITPGRVTKPDGDPYRVFTPFYRAWSRHGWPAPAKTTQSSADWIKPKKSLSIPDYSVPKEMSLPKPGESAALKLWRDFQKNQLENYDSDRDRPDFSGTTRISPYLRWGCIHPRTLLADLAGLKNAGASSLRSELAWREFYADVLWNRPETARHNFDKRFDSMKYDTGKTAQEAFDQWCQGKTGFPIVDAGMRQLKAEGWMHNRVRMVVASFLVKDLHLPWWWGARHFMNYLVDGDLASNQLNWQWVAGSGTDAAPYFRIFNPTTQGEKFDPQGDYVRKYVAELRKISGKSVHQPWKLREAPKGYPAPIVDHAQERHVALQRYETITK